MISGFDYIACLSAIWVKNKPEQKYYVGEILMLVT